MNTLLWILQIVLALVFLMAGVMKLMKTKAELRKQMAWVEDFEAHHVKGIGMAEVLGALGLVLPAWTGILPILTPIAATALAVTMLLAASTHVRRGELPYAGANVVLFVLLAVVVWGRFGSYSL